MYIRDLGFHLFIIAALVVLPFFLPPGLLWSLLVPVSGAALVSVAKVHKILRTEEILDWKLWSIPSDPFERILYLYGYPLFIAGGLAFVVRTGWT
jgi:hypothetical protein